MNYLDNAATTFPKPEIVYKTMDTYRKGENEYSLVEAYPKTGRTHQIRVHFKAINHPVICDNLYAPKHICGLGFERLALHSKSLKFSLINGETVLVESELPKDFKYALTLLV